VVMAGTGNLQFRRIIDLNNTLSVQDDRSAMVHKWHAAIELNLNRVMAIAKSGNQAALSAYLTERMADTTKRINELQKTLESSLEAPAQKSQLERIASTRSTYVEMRKKVLDALKQDPVAGMARVDAELVPAADAYMQAVMQLVEQIDKQSDEMTAALQAGASQAARVLAVLAAIATISGVLVAWRITKSVTTPIARAGVIAQLIANGDLSEDIVVDRQDEIGLLLEQLKTMQGALRRMVAEVRDGTESINTATSEIAHGYQDLSMRTEQAAANLEETASSMDELTSTVSQTAESTRMANQLVSSARSAAAKGGEVVSQVVSTMDEINASSKKISDIIGVIDGIAFQTNILALNAAVESARAGEQGRGFAVVAAEVRSLAQRSATAAREIKSLIGESVSRVETGARLVAGAGGTMDEIVTSVQRVADIIGEIASAASEQSTGIAQVNIAVTSLDTMTQQNAALVEEGAAAAASLSQQAEKLSIAVAVFRN